MIGGTEDNGREGSTEVKEASLAAEASSIAEATKEEAHNKALEDTEDGETADSGHQPTLEEELAEISDSKQAARFIFQLSIFSFEFSLSFLQ
jgi:hypothetical protein